MLNARVAAPTIVLNGVLRSLLLPVLAFLITAIAGGALFAFLGKNPGDALSAILLQPFASPNNLSEVLLKSIPLILYGVGLSICYRANVWNIGAEGQLLGGALVTSCMVLAIERNLSLSPWMTMLVATLAGAIGGMIVASFIAFAKDFCNANEILVSLMLTYAAQLAIIYAVSGPLRDPQGMNFPQSALFASALPIIWDGTRLHAGFLVAFVVAGCAWIFMDKSYVGYKISIRGMAPHAARYAGFSARQAIWVPLLVCGALSGIAGAYEVVGPIGQLIPKVSPGYGFAAIIVAFISRLNPLGVLFGGFAMAVLYVGGGIAQSTLQIPASVTDVFQGILLLSLLAVEMIVTPSKAAGA